MTRASIASIVAVAALACVAAAATPGAAGLAQTAPAPEPALPAVVEALVPQYPREAVTAGAAGIVRIKVVTDGAKATAAIVQPSVPVLDEAAIRNVRTWRFAPHPATRFDVTFRYTMLDRPCESLGRDTHAAASIHFPIEVNVFAERDARCPGAAPLPPVFGIYVREAWIPPYPAAARASGIDGAVRIGITPKGELSVVEGPAELGNPLVVAIRKWMLVPPPFADEMRVVYTLADGDCRSGGPIVTIGPGLTTYEITATRGAGCR